MTKKTYLMLLLLALFSLMTSGCFSIEQEIFLENDGSGEMVMHLSLPDLPEELLKNAPPAAGANQPDPKVMIEEMKQKFASGLPPTVKLKEVKEVKQNGAYGFYIVLHFQQLSDLEAALDSYSKNSIGEKTPDPKTKDESYWKVAIEKKGNLTVITQRLFLDLASAMSQEMMTAEKKKTAEAKAAEPVAEEPTPKAAPKPAAKRTNNQVTRTPATKAKPATTANKEEEPAAPPTESSIDPFSGLMGGEMMQMMFSMMFKFRFIVHAPKNFTETNADIVLNGKTAIWNASLGAFINEKDPKEKRILEMKVAY